MTVPLTPATLAFREDGTPFSPLYDDVYHSASGAFGQAAHVFLRGNALPARWQKRRVFTILETGFGLGVNFLATWAAWRADPARCERLHFVSVEKHPFRRDDLRRVYAALAAAQPSVEALAHLVTNAWPVLVPGLHRLEFDEGRVTLSLLFGDAITALPKLWLRADAFYLDGFAPVKNPDLWSPALFKSLARVADEHATFATWSSAGDVKRALEQHGFEYRKIEGFGAKRTMLAGRFAPRWRVRRYEPPRPFITTPAQRHAIVIGAGLAGCALVERLAARDWQVTLVEKNPAPAQEASGNPAGVFHPLISRDDSSAARITRAGFLYALQRWAALDAAGHPPLRSHGGLLHLAASDEMQQTARDEAAVADSHTCAGSSGRSSTGLPTSSSTGLPADSLADLPAGLLAGLSTDLPASSLADLFAGLSNGSLAGSLASLSTGLFADSTTNSTANSTTDLATGSSADSFAHPTTPSADWPADYATPVSREEAQRIAGLALTQSGWFYPQGGWISPASLCAAQCAVAGARLGARFNAHFGTQATRIARHGDEWFVYDRDARVIAHAPVVIFANASDAARMAGLDWMPTRIARGQLTWMPQAGQNPLASLRVPIIGNGYALPPLPPALFTSGATFTPPEHVIHHTPRHATDTTLIGATYDLDDTNTALHAASHAENLARVAQMLPSLHTWLASNFHANSYLPGRVGFRCVTSDRLPMLGPLADEAAARRDAERLRGAWPLDLPRAPGLYGAFAFGSRGLVWAALGAEMISSQLEGEPWPLERDLADHLDPARFLQRARRQRKFP